MSDKVKVTLEPSVSPAAASTAAPTDLPDDVVIDAKGRRLRIKEPDILQESRMVKAMGDAAANFAYMTSYVHTAAMVVEIDGEPMPFPMSERQVDAAIVRLGREGLMAVMAFLTKKAEQMEKARADVKNS